MNDLFPIGGPDSKKTQTCHACGQKIRKLNPHGMDRKKVSLLERIAKLNVSGVKWVKIQQDGALIPEAAKHFTIQTDAVHACRLKWFGLLDLKEERSGMYRVTAAGISFLRGKIAVPSKIWCSGGEVVRQSEEFVNICDVKDVTFNRGYWADYPAFQRYRDEI